MLKNLKEVLEDVLDNTKLFYILWAVCYILVSPTLYLALYGLIGIDGEEDKISSLLSVFFLLEMLTVYGVLSSKRLRNPRVLFVICRVLFQ